MFPTLLELGPITIRSYGLMLAISFLVGITYAARRAAQDGLNPDRVIGLTWLLILLGIMGSRAMYVIQHPGDFAADPLEAIRVWRGGLTLYGGLILAVVGGLIYMHRRTRRPWQYVDAMAPFISLGEGISRVGCFLNGCCFGKICELPWAVRFPADAHATQVLGAEHHVHPSQLYQAILGFGAFFLLSWVWRRRSFDGQVFWLFVLLHGASRLVVDFFRYYEESQSTVFGGVPFSDSQLLSIAVMITGFLGLRIAGRRSATDKA